MTTHASQEGAKIKYVYPFGADFPPPPLDVNLLGGKGKGLAEMATLGLPIPPGFIITTEACNTYRKNEHHYPSGLEERIVESMKQLEEKMGKEFGSETNPLLVSVRSGAPASMPGMMDTVLNLGLNDRSVLGFAEQTHNEQLAYDSYRRLIAMYADIVKGVDRAHFEEAFHVLKMQEAVENDYDLSINGLKEACSLFKQIYRQNVGKDFPQDAYEQLFEAIAAVFESWDGERATLYRQINHIPDEWGTAVNVQIMVFGNKNMHSATGVGFTRDPATGENQFYGEFLLDAQGEEVVAGIRTPHPINKYQKQVTKSELESLEELMPEVYQELLTTITLLEKHFNDMQDIEFTIDDGKLYMLQTRTGKRTGFAAVRMAVEMLEAGLIDEKTALLRIQPEQLSQLLAPIFDTKVKKAAQDKMVGKGLNAGPGAASGKAAFSADKAVEFKKQGQDCILIRKEANPDDYPGIVSSEGILTVRGGSTSHAAVVARGMGKPCVVGCGVLNLNESAKTISANGLTIHEGDSISIDGSTGEVFFCCMESSPSEVVQVVLTKTKKPEESFIYQQYKKIMDMADHYRTLHVRTNADTPQDSTAARAFGAEGIGLCRTEHMFMDVNRLNDVRRLFFSTNPEERKHSIDLLLPHQKEDFIGIFRAMQGLPVTIRLLDPPLHEFMPHGNDELETLARSMGISLDRLLEIRASLEERNPMLGHRGCRLGITYPELTEMQTQAILEAALIVTKEGLHVHPEIMIPLVGITNELIHQKAIIEATAKRLFEKHNFKVPYTIGTMIELPRAALIAGQIAKDVSFFSFGTNDLTQTVFGISRDDSAKFVPTYVKGIPNPLEKGELIHILNDDPFQVLDREGVGAIMRLAVDSGRRANPSLECGICGEHGGESSSVEFCHQIGLNYVSCSPYRIPVARLAAAQAVIK